MQTIRYVTTVAQNGAMMDPAVSRIWSNSTMDCMLLTWYRSTVQLVVLIQSLDMTSELQPTGSFPKWTCPTSPKGDARIATAMQAFVYIAIIFISKGNQRTRQKNHSSGLPRVSWERITVVVWTSYPFSAGEKWPQFQIFSPSPSSCLQNHNWARRGDVDPVPFAYLKLLSACSPPPPCFSSFKGTDTGSGAC